jgi:hypothetical protein
VDRAVVGAGWLQSCGKVGGSHNRVTENELDAKCGSQRGYPEAVLSCTLKDLHRVPLRSGGLLARITSDHSLFKDGLTQSASVFSPQLCPQIQTLVRVQPTFWPRWKVGACFLDPAVR